ncbi:MAG: TolC family protein, partial [Elusimicrobia bacterium]|nr:TolC family protein [Elusimicrobiota bacterium]
DAELVQARARVEAYDAALLPLRDQISAESLKRYNVMLAGAYDLLYARREDLEDELGRIDAARDYWTAEARLELATGGTLPPAAAPAGGMK